MINYCVNIQKKVKKDNQENYELIKELIEGTLISLVYNMDQKYFEYKKEFAKPDIFIDTNLLIYYIGSAEGHEYPNLQVGDEVDPRLSFCVNSKSINRCFF